MINEIVPLLINGLIVLTLVMGVLWLLHFKIGNAGIVDVGWSAGLAFLGLYYALAGNGFGPRRALIGVMVVVWGARLALHLWFDRIRNKPEDPRYTTIRESWGRAIGLKLFFFFEFQAVLAVALSFPFALLATDPLPELSGFEYAGFFLWVVALGGEALADSQLKRFKSDPTNKGRTCQDGLWYHSRHPNYFFEWLIWVAYFITSLNTPFGWLSIFCPALMLYFLFKVTGIPATEAQALRSRGEEYREYQRTTSAFVPWIKKA